MRRAARTLAQRHPGTALDTWATWRCYCGAGGESCDYDAASRAFRTHYLNTHYYGPNGTQLNGAIGLALSLSSPASMVP